MAPWGFLLAVRRGRRRGLDAVSAAYTAQVVPLCAAVMPHIAPMILKPRSGAVSSFSGRRAMNFVADGSRSLHDREDRSSLQRPVRRADAGEYYRECA